MRTVSVETEPPYDVRIGRGVLAEVAGAVGPPLALVSDANVAPLHAAALGLGEPTCILPAGEAAKTFAELERLLDAMAAAGLDREATVVALGGGTVGDVAGLSASLFMRGIDVVQCPTTLLAMVDASVGGKTAVNLAAGKNLAGTVHQPRAVFADVETLTTLPGEELASGLGEVVKSALIGDAGLLDRLEADADAVVGGDLDVLEEVVWRCVRVKARIVAEDEREDDRRRVLNLGHTFAHAVEHVAGYGRVPHGMAVAAGLVLALEASSRIGLLAEADLARRAAELLGRLGLPTGLDDLRRRYSVPLAPDELASAMALDKKGRSGEPRFVLVRATGEVEVDVPLGAGVLESLLAPT